MWPEGVYVRQGTSSAPETDSAIKDTDGNSFENIRSLERELTVDTAKQEFQGRRLAFDQPQMKTLGLLNTDGIYTNLGFLLSEQCTHTVKAAVFEGRDQSVFRDRQEFSGSLLGQLNSVYDYIDRRNHVRSTFDKLRRIDERDYPEVAIREALLNSLVHRDYSYSASTLVNYDDRIEFTSINGLMGGISLNDILLGMSICRNPKLANVFYWLQQLIETSDNAFKITLGQRKLGNHLRMIWKTRCCVSRRLQVRTRGKRRRR